jgi:hypothetical protein
MALAAALAIATTAASPALAAHWHHHHHGWGGLAAGAAGFAAGAALGSALAGPPAYYGPYGYAAAPTYGSGVQYCIDRFKSYNPNTGLYLGYDGRYHHCP